jgi:hypothetical protein
MASNIAHAADQTPHLGDTSLPLPMFLSYPLHHQHNITHIKPWLLLLTEPQHHNDPPSLHKLHLPNSKTKPFLHQPSCTSLITHNLACHYPCGHQHLQQALHFSHNFPNTLVQRHQHTPQSLLAPHTTNRPDHSTHTLKPPISKPTITPPPTTSTSNGPDHLPPGLNLTT